MVGSEMYPLARIDLKCGDCGAEMRLRTSPKWDRPFYGCSKFPECRGSHGARTDGAPLGVPGNKETKLARIRAHKVFDVLWQDKLMTRGQAYSWMQKRMQLTKGEAHFSKFDVAECEKVIEFVKADFPVVRTAWDRILETPFDTDDPFVVEGP